MTLENWAESDFINWLSEPRFTGKRLFFFGELRLTLDWFVTQVQKQMAAVQDRFNPLLHTETHIDIIIHKLLGDKSFAQRIRSEIVGLETRSKEYDEAVANLNGSQPYQIQWGNSKTALVVAAQSLQNALNDAITRVKYASSLLAQQRFHELQEIEWRAIWVELDQAYDAYSQTESAFDVSLLKFTGKDEEKKKVLDEAERIIDRPAHRAASLLDDLNRTFADFEDLKKSELHVLGGAGDGKTHLACHVCHERTEAGLPALLILGIHFTDRRPLTEQLRGILDIPPSYSWNDFLQALATNC